jgi:diguanylate cyclase (GGDEF)-like protein
VLSVEGREIDVVARLGGEEFTVLLPGSDDADAEAFTERVRRALATGHVDLPTVRVSAGVVATDTPDTIDQLLRRADAALYEAKRSGRDRTVIGSLAATAKPISDQDPYRSITPR